MNKKFNDDCPIYKGCFPVIVGPQGPEGPPGPTPTLTIGTVTTGAPGTEASASITGTPPNFVLNLVLPQGPIETE